MSPKIKKSYKEQDNKLVVLNHGDCWNNNMLFQKDPASGKATKHIFVDLQVQLLLQYVEEEPRDWLLKSKFVRFYLA